MVMSQVFKFSQPYILLDDDDALDEAFEIYLNTVFSSTLSCKTQPLVIPLMPKCCALCGHWPLPHPLSVVLDRMHRYMYVGF